MSITTFKDSINSLLNPSNSWIFSSSWILNGTNARPTTTYEKTMATMFHYSGEWIASFFGWDKAHSNVVYQVDGLRDLIINGYKQDYTLISEQLTKIKQNFSEHRMIPPSSLNGVQDSLNGIQPNRSLLNAEQNSQVRWATYYTQSAMNAENPDYDQIAETIITLCKLREFSETAIQLAIDALDSSWNQIREPLTVSRRRV